MKTARYPTRNTTGRVATATVAAVMKGLELVSARELDPEVPEHRRVPGEGQRVPRGGDGDGKQQRSVRRGQREAPVTEPKTKAAGEATIIAIEREAEHHEVGRADPAGQ